MRKFLLAFAGAAAATALIVGIMFMTGGIGIINKIDKIEVVDLAHPTMEQLTDFIEKDKTELLNFGIIIFPPTEIGKVDAICIDFAITLRANAMYAGWDFDFIILNFEGERGHAICGVEINDGTYYCIEPQNDNIFLKPDVGDNYGIGGQSLTIEYIGVVD